QGRSAPDPGRRPGRRLPEGSGVARRGAQADGRRGSRPGGGSGWLGHAGEIVPLGRRRRRGRLGRPAPGRRSRHRSPRGLQIRSQAAGGRAGKPRSIPGDEPRDRAPSTQARDRSRLSVRRSPRRVRVLRGRSAFRQGDHFPGGIMKRSAQAVWEGALNKGQGHLTTDSKQLEGARYSYPPRFGNEVGTNPEELIAAAHAGCYSMSLAYFLGEAGFPPERIQTTAELSLERSGGALTVPGIHLRVAARVPG